MARISFKGGAMLAPVPPALVTVGNAEKANVLTVAWTGILCSDPPKTYISVRPTRFSHDLLMQGRDFVIHLPATRQIKKVDYCGIFTGAKVDKFEKCGFTRVASAAVAAPTIAECPIALECRVTDIISLGSHDMFMADIVAVTADDTLLDEKGKLHMEKASLCAYAHGEYYALGRKIGQFGFSAAKRRQGKTLAGGKTNSDAHGYGKSGGGKKSKTGAGGNSRGGRGK